MAARNSSSSFKLWSLYHYRNISAVSWRAYHTHHRDNPPWSRGSDPGLSLLCATSRPCSQPKFEMGIDQAGQVQPPSSNPTKFDFSNWAKWLVGSIITILLPFWKSKWDNLLRLEGKVENIVKDVDMVAEVVEKVATTTDAALAEVANQLPDNSELKAAAQVMEHVANVTAQEAKLIDNIIHKVGDVKQDLEDLEAVVEPIVEKLKPLQQPNILEKKT